MPEYVLVYQGVEIFRTKNKNEAEKIQRENNEEWNKYVQKCLDNGDTPADNEIFLYEE